MWGRSALLVSLCLGCAGARRVESAVAAAPTSVPDASVPAWTEAEGTRSRAALEAALTRLRGGELALLEAQGVRFRAAQRSVELTGEAAPDERLGELRSALQVEASAAVLVQSSCGNVWLLGLRWDGREWSSRGRYAVIDDRRPGGCFTLRATTETQALLSQERREVLLALDATDTVGEVGVPPSLWVLRVEPDGTLRALLEREPFGWVDERNGEVLPAAALVVEDLPPPRDLFLSGRFPPRGERQQRRYHFDGARLSSQR